MESPKRSFKKMKVGQRVRVGDTLVSCEPFVTAVEKYSRGQICHHCLKKGQLTPCSGCNCDHYCSDTCRSAAQPLHQHECPYLPALLRDGLECTQHLLLKLVIKLKNGGDEEWVRIDDQLSRQFRHLAKHTEFYRADKDICKSYETTKALLTKHLPRGFLPSDDALFDMFATLAVNQFFTTDNDGVCISVAIYIEASSYNHSCRPNAVFSFDGRVISVRSLVDLPNYHRDKVFLAYCDPLSSYSERQDLFWTHYYFECKCDRCTDVFSLATEGAICCGNPTCPYPIEVPDRLLNPPNPGLECELTPAEEAQNLSCPRCGFKEFPASVLDDYKELLERCKETVKQINEEEPSEEDEDLMAFVWHQVLRLQQRRKKSHDQLMLHPLNIYWVQLLKGAATLAIQIHHPEKALTFIEMNIQGMQYYCGRNAHVVGLEHYTMGKICIYMNRIKPALRHFKEAENILKVTVGADHPLLVDELYPLIDGARAVRSARKDPMSLRSFRSCAKKLALLQKKTHNWLYYSFGGLLLTMVYLGVTGV